MLNKITLPKYPAYILNTSNMQFNSSFLALLAALATMAVASPVKDSEVS